MSCEGKKLSEEHKEKIRKSLLGKKRGHINYPKNRKKKSKEDCKKISDKLKGRHLSEEHKRKISESEKGKIITDEVRKKISEATKEKMKDPEIRKKCVLGAVKSFKTGLKKTKIEVKVEEQLKKYCIRFVTQKPICNGHFILDFWLPDYDLVIECNGDYWHNLPDRKKRDKELENFVFSKGKDILWLWEHVIKHDSFDISDYLEV